MKVSDIANNIETRIKTVNKVVAKVFEDLNAYREFCRFAYLNGHDGYVFNERDLYNPNSPWGVMQNVSTPYRNSQRRNNFRKR